MGSYICCPEQAGSLHWMIHTSLNSLFICHKSNGQTLDTGNSTRAVRILFHGKELGVAGQGWQGGSPGYCWKPRLRFSCSAIVSIWLLSSRLVTLSSKTAAGAPAVKVIHTFKGPLQKCHKLVLHSTDQNSVVWPRLPREPWKQSLHSGQDYARQSQGEVGSCRQPPVAAFLVYTYRKSRGRFQLFHPKKDGCTPPPPESGDSNALSIFCSNNLHNKTKIHRSVSLLFVFQSSMECPCSKSKLRVSLSRDYAMYGKVKLGFQSSIGIFHYFISSPLF